MLSAFLFPIASPQKELQDLAKEAMVDEGHLEDLTDCPQQTSLAVHTHVMQCVFSHLVHHLSVGNTYSMTDEL